MHLDTKIVDGRRKSIAVIARGLCGDTRARTIRLFRDLAGATIWYLKTHILMGVNFLVNVYR
jgi:hypothetical protein